VATFEAALEDEGIHWTSTTEALLLSEAVLGGWRS
jgi:hypothetical protein